MPDTDRNSPPTDLSSTMPVASRALDHGSVASYEQRLTRNPRWAMDEGDRYFRKDGGAHDALRRVTKRLNELGILYAVAGGLALFRHTNLSV